MLASRVSRFASYLSFTYFCLWRNCSLLSRSCKLGIGDQVSIRSTLYRMVRRSQAQADVDVAEGAPAKKRPKIEEEAAREDALGSPQPAPNSFEPRHEYLWWRDGNVIVAADGMSFKLHASILERHSSVFRELLDSAQPRENSPETFERCTVLRVEDKGALLAELLQVLYDGGSG